MPDRESFCAGSFDVTTSPTPNLTARTTNASRPTDIKIIALTDLAVWSNLIPPSTVNASSHRVHDEYIARILLRLDSLLGTRKNLKIIFFAHSA
jgi:hypothetical protein